MIIRPLRWMDFSLLVAMCSISACKNKDAPSSTNRADFKDVCLALRVGDALSDVGPRLEAAGGVPARDNPIHDGKRDWYRWTISRNEAGGLPYCSVQVDDDKRVSYRVYDVSYGGN